MAVAVAVSEFGDCLTCCYMCMCYTPEVRKSDDDGKDLRFDGMFLEPCLRGSISMVFIKLSCIKIM